VLSVISSSLVLAFQFQALWAFLPARFSFICGEQKIAIDASTKELLSMKRVFHKSKSFKEAEEWDVLQHARLTPEQRLKAAAELKKRAFGDDLPRILKVRVKK
jgi:hypothetical protein